MRGNLPSRQGHIRRRAGPGGSRQNCTKRRKNIREHKDRTLAENNPKDKKNTSRLSEASSLCNSWETMVSKTHTAGPPYFGSSGVTQSEGAPPS